MLASPPAVDHCLQRWRNQLIDLTRRNPLLSLKPRRSSFVEIAGPPLAELFPLLVRENQHRSWPFWIPPEDEKDARTGSRGKPSAPPRPDANIVATGPGGTTLTRAELLRILTNLYRRAHTDFEERGLHVLHLACGILEWKDADNETLRSPLVLLPVELKRNSLKEPFVLRAANEEAVLNPALEARLLQDFDFPLPPIPDWDEKSLPQYLDELQGAITGLPGWKVQPGCVLTLFSFFKGVIHQDLGEHREHILDHPIVRVLAGAGTLPAVEVPTEEELDSVQDPGRAFTILDADVSQRASLEAAHRSQSFVLIGPPGTGKSQTIANLIAENIALGRKVLFVSEKMAALEVVYKRLRHAGLGDYCLELHSHKANKREVVAELARCLEDRPKPGTAPSEDDFRRVQERRWQLQNYVQALHQIREPMRRSVWQVLAELPRWHDLPTLPLGLPIVGANGQTRGLVLAEIPAGRVPELEQLLRRLEQLWHVGRVCPWHGFKADRFTLQLRDEVLTLVDKVSGRLEKLRGELKAYSTRLGVTAPLAQILKLGALLEHRPAQLHDRWLRETDLSVLESDLANCARRYGELSQARAPLTQRYGEALWSLPAGTARAVAEHWLHAGGLLAEDGDGARLLAHQQKLRAWAADTQKRLSAWSADIRTLEKWLGVPLSPGAGGQGAVHANLDPAPHTLRLFLRLVHLAQSEHPPERTWLHNPDDLKNVQQIMSHARPIFHSYRQGRARLLETYTEQFFDLELGRMAEGFSGPYRSWFRFLNGKYRQDCRALRRRARSGEYPASAPADVLLGREVAQQRTQIDADEPRRKPLLGRYEKGIDTDIDAADKAARIAAEALDVLRQLGCTTLPTRFLDTICSSAPPAEKIRLTAKRLQESFTAWSHATEELKDVLPMSELPGVGLPLEECSLTAICHYAHELQAPLNHLGRLTESILGHGRTLPPDMKTMNADLTRAEEFRTVESQDDKDSQGLREQFGPGFHGLATDWNQLGQALAWVRKVREWFAGHEQKPGTLPVPPEPFLALTAAPPLKDLRHALEQYEHALHSLEIRFDAPGPIHEGKRLAEHDLDAIQAQLVVMRGGVAQLEQWIDWRHLPERFNHLGLEGFLQQLLQLAPPADQLAGIFWKSFWTAWIDMIFAGDAVLSNFRRAEHEAHLAEYRELDEKLVRLGAARVIQQAERQHQQPEAQKTLLVKEAHKKIKHLPLRRLFEALPDLLLDLKPCLLMSPLSVSQYLPADPGKLRFDLVVFDEASQILPEDAIGAIYRGRQVVITGDNRQLPPTTFFQTLEEADSDGEDLDEPAVFESVLDAALAAGFPSRMLRWHYRSRHESLIAFANARFYEGKLVTFPAARDRQLDLGVHFHFVEGGVYERGGRRINLAEARAVADLIVEHFRTQPGKTLGVIAFSYPQMTAIQDEIDRRLQVLPELEKFIDGDRLEGFFIKNLETVQGDERDVILLSVGYGRDEAGKLLMNFGPLNRDGGARRLNVAVTRARQKLLVVSSLRGRDIVAPGPESGLAYLQEYLEFAERGSLPQSPERGRMPILTPLHDDISAEIKRLGFAATPLLGTGSYRLDLGVVHPHKPGEFVLGIQLDGPAYAAAAAARDRERIRPAMLAALGWKLHQVWAPDWVLHRSREIERLARALENPA